MENYLFQLRFTAKQLERNSKKCLRQETMEKSKCKRAIQRGNFDGARVHAENAIRHKNQSLQYLQMSARVDAVVARVRSAMSSRSIAHSIGGVSRAIEVAMRSLNLERISQIMDRFEQQFDQLDVSSEMVEQTMDNSNGTLVLERPTQQLMQQIADEAGLDLNLKLPSAIHSKLMLGPSAGNATKRAGKTKRKTNFNNIQTKLSTEPADGAAPITTATNNNAAVLNSISQSLKFPSLTDTNLVDHLWANPDLSLKKSNNDNDADNDKLDQSSPPPPPPPPSSPSLSLPPPPPPHPISPLDINFGAKNNNTNNTDDNDPKTDADARARASAALNQSIQDELTMRLAKLRQR